MFARERSFSILSNVQVMLHDESNESLRILISINVNVISVMSNFLRDLRNTLSDYSDFYSGHSRTHFLQLDDYSSSTERSQIRMLALSTLDF